MVGCFGRGTWLVCFVEAAVAVAGVGNIGHQEWSLAGGLLGRNVGTSQSCVGGNKLAIARPTRHERSQLTLGCKPRSE